MDIVGEQCGKNYYYHVGNRQFELAELKLRSYTGMVLKHDGAASHQCDGEEA